MRERPSVVLGRSQAHRHTQPLEQIPVFVSLLCVQVHDGALRRSLKSLGTAHSNHIE